MLTRTGVKDKNKDFNCHSNQNFKTSRDSDYAHLWDSLLSHVRMPNWYTEFEDSTFSHFKDISGGVKF